MMSELVRPPRARFTRRKLLLGLGLCGHACCLIGHVHATGAAFPPPICMTLSQINGPGI